MRRLILLAAFAWLASAPAMAQSDPEPITIGHAHTIDSAILGETRSFQVYLPATYDEHRSRRYPVLYLLDGGAHFHSATGVVQFMSTGINGNHQIPELIVVAISNTNRTRDLTPTHSTMGLRGIEETSFAASGGGDNFLRFVRDELFPHVEETYLTMPIRILVGHSFGGLLALHALLNFPEMFQVHIAIDPSVWWDDRVLIRQAQNSLEAGQTYSGSVYISSAASPVYRDWDLTVAGTAIRQLAGILDSSANPDLRVLLEHFEAESHGSVPLLSLYNGLLHTFDGYKIPITTETVSAIKAHFERFEERTGLSFEPPERYINSTAYWLMSIEDHEEAGLLFKTNVSLYPDSPNALDSLGDWYKTQDSLSTALDHYSKACSLAKKQENDRLASMACGNAEKTEKLITAEE